MRNMVTHTLSPCVCARVIVSGSVLEKKAGRVLAANFNEKSSMKGVCWTQDTDPGHEGSLLGGEGVGGAGGPQVVGVGQGEVGGSQVGQGGELGNFLSHQVVPVNRDSASDWKTRNPGTWNVRNTGSSNRPVLNSYRCRDII